MTILESLKHKNRLRRTALLFSVAALRVLLVPAQGLAQQTTYDVVVQRDVMVAMRMGGTAGLSSSAQTCSSTCLPSTAGQASSATRPEDATS